MKWTLKRIEKETDHRFLNFYTFTFDVEQDGEHHDHPYYVASRHEEKDLTAVTKSYARPDGVRIIAFKRKPVPSLLVIEEFRPPLNAYVTNLPAGLLDESDENVETAAIRETLEETGAKLENVRLLCPSSPTSAGLSDELLSIVVGEVNEVFESRLEEFEDIHARFVPLSEIPDLLNDPNRLIALDARLCMMMAKDL